MFQRLFLFSAYKKDRKSFWFFLCFILFQILFSIKGVETFPFFHFGMFSGDVPSEFTTYELIIDGRPSVHFFSSETYSVLKRNLDVYENLNKISNGDFKISRTITERVPKKWVPFFNKQLTNQQSCSREFKDWIARFIRYHTKKPFKHFEIYKTSFNPNNKKIKRKLMFSE